jgi:hypothetical protein
MNAASGCLLRILFVHLSVNFCKRKVKLCTTPLRKLPAIIHLGTTVPVKEGRHDRDLPTYKSTVQGERIEIILGLLMLL